LPRTPSFSLFRLASEPSPVPTLSAFRRSCGSKVQVILHRFHTPRENLPQQVGQGFALLDAWAVGVLQDGVFIGQWQVQRTRRSRELPQESGWLKVAQGPLAVRAYDLLGRGVTAEL
ncbi:MAG: hypothetical protein RMJ98_19495, partial [Myxococcales bacterium]|nr:hypothetical protein [Polyangiaceae bacterium]MDW8251485.1 hypothetical protein [Myxococcales bacterium]